MISIYFTIATQVGLMFVLQLILWCFNLKVKEKQVKSKKQICQREHI